MARQALCRSSAVKMDDHRWTIRYRCGSEKKSEARPGTFTLYHTLHLPGPTLPVKIPGGLSSFVEGRLQAKGVPDRARLTVLPSRPLFQKFVNEVQVIAMSFRYPQVNPDSFAMIGASVVAGLVPSLAQSAQCVFNDTSTY